MSDGHHSYRELRPFTRRLAELFASERGTLALAQLQQLALLKTPRLNPPPADTGLRIGIWMPVVEEDGSVAFVRSQALAHEWRYWADVDRIPAKRGPRVVLVGESVARGYLFDPYITPASELSTMLGGTEVIDLARTDLGLDGLRALIEALPALEPDAIVLFAGNNWFNVVFELDDLQRLAGAIRCRGYASCRQIILDEIIPSRCRSVLDALAATVREFTVPVVLVVPEFNLADWRGEPTVLAPVLPGDGNVRWMEIRRRAEEALRDGRHEEAGRGGRDLIALDGGTSPAGPTLSALARPDEARLWLERARDAVAGILVAHSPRCVASVQALLRERSTEEGFAIVDLPRLFESAGNGAVPGRELFLDYCHLTVAGMRLAMGAVAQELAPRLATRVVPPASVAAGPEHEATGHFMAAIHNAHYGQPDHILHYHCTKAALSPMVREHMVSYLDCISRWAEPWLCRSFAKICESAIIRRYLLAPEVRSQKLADFRLIEAIVSALEDAGVRARRPIERLLADEHAADRVDLLDVRYRASTFRERGGYTLAAERAFVRALDLKSRFALIRRCSGAVRLEITCRTAAGGVLDVHVNDHPCRALAVDRTWQTSTVTVPVREGLNWIDLVWPASAPPADELERAASRLERGLYPDVLPAFGEIHTFTASDDN